MTAAPGLVERIDTRPVEEIVATGVPTFAVNALGQPSGATHEPL